MQFNKHSSPFLNSVSNFFCRSQSFSSMLGCTCPRINNVVLCLLNLFFQSGLCPLILLNVSKTNGENHTLSCGTLIMDLYTYLGFREDLHTNVLDLFKGSLKSFDHSICHRVIRFGHYRKRYTCTSLVGPHVNQVSISFMLYFVWFPNSTMEFQESFYYSHFQMMPVHLYAKYMLVIYII